MLSWAKEKMQLDKNFSKEFGQEGRGHHSPMKDYNASIRLNDWIASSIDKERKGSAGRNK